MGVTGTEIVFGLLQIHLELGNLLEQLRFLGLNLLLVLGFLAPPELLASAIKKQPLPLAHLDWMDGVMAAIFWIVLLPLIASMASLALNSGQWVRRLLIGGSPYQGRCPASEVNDRACLEKQPTSKRAGESQDASSS